MPENPFRQSVVGVFINDEGKVLLGERSDAPGAWQLPQGGVDPGESHDQAIVREMREELGVNGFDIIRRATEMCSYEFPPTLPAGIAKNFRGQEQQWYLLRFQDHKFPDLAAADGEFRAVAWQPVTAAIDGVIEWKRDCYRKGFRLLGLWK
ncbi:MAG: hypothetical protein RIQ81_2084 [Pseudomonadota bacterium]|jgi:putative (di)nucleoside polyphosphate hydrolase